MQISGAIASAQQYAERARAEERLREHADKLARSNDELERFARALGRDFEGLQDRDFKTNVDLLRGDLETRWASHEIAVKNRILTPNEVRRVEGWNARDGGDDFPQAAPET